MKKGMFIAMVLVSFLAISAFAAQSMKIAVASAGKTPEAAVSDMPASAPYFLLFDGKGKLLEAIDNPYKNALNPAAGTANINVEKLAADLANYFADKGATVVVAEFFGPPIVDSMKARGIAPATFKGTAQDAVKKVLQSK
jgi:predicted Fe-Mo cluster-binding NifX family protein